MRTIFIISIPLLLLFGACNYPGPIQPATDIPTQDYAYTECGYAWAHQSLADLSKEFEQALKETLPQSSGYAEAYGENCLNNQGEVMRFLAMETDFYVTLKVENIGDKQALGELTEQVLVVVTDFPVEETPGPQPGYVGITFKASGDEMRLWFTQTNAETALENGLRGEELFNALQTK
jgi:hypothetical protein